MVSRTASVSKQRRSFCSIEISALPIEIPHPEILPGVGASWVPSETREPRCEGRSGAGVGLRGTGSDGEGSTCLGKNTSGEMWSRVAVCV